MPFEGLERLSKGIFYIYVNVGASASLHSSRGIFFACTCKSNCLYMYKQLHVHVQAKNRLCSVMLLYGYVRM